jgi:glucose 1-dehydrogenase
MKRLEGKVALITGSSRGIGRGIALCMAEEGADIVINYRSHPEEAEEVAHEVEALGQQALTIQTDVSDRNAVESMFNQAVEHFGHVDIVVANAGISIREYVLDAEWENVLKTIEVSQFGTFHTCQFAAQQMVKQIEAGRPGGKIIIISSILEEIAPQTSAAYNMTKAAINHLGRTMAAELAKYRINVNMLNPGWIDTPGERKYVNEEQIIEGAKRIPWQRLGTPEDMGKAAAFLASADADYITGATLRIDGGFVLGMTLPDPQ